MGNNLVKEEVALRYLSTRILSSAIGKFGPDSNEVETLGGIRTSDSKTKAKGGKTIKSDLAKVA